jgi:hypothetical protein
MSRMKKRLKSLNDASRILACPLLHLFTASEVTHLLEQISENQRLEKPEEAPCKIKASLLIIGFNHSRKENRYGR